MSWNSNLIATVIKMDLKGHGVFVKLQVSRPFCSPSFVFEYISFFKWHMFVLAVLQLGIPVWHNKQTNHHRFETNKSNFGGTFFIKLNIEEILSVAHMGLISCTDAPTDCTNKTHDVFFAVVLHFYFSCIQAFHTSSIPAGTQ